MRVPNALVSPNSYLHADTREPGRNEVSMAKIAELITYLFIRVLALGDKGKRRFCLNSNKEHRVFVKLDGKQRQSRGGGIFRMGPRS